MTYTYAILEISQAAFDEIADKLRDADYHRAFRRKNHEPDISIDMHGIAVRGELCWKRCPNTLCKRLKECRVPSECLMAFKHA